MESEIEITFNTLIRNPEILDQIIFSSLNSSYGKRIKNIVAETNKKYKLNLNSNEKQKLARHILNRINILLEKEIIIKEKDRYFLYNYK